MADTTPHGDEQFDLEFEAAPEPAFTEREILAFAVDDPWASPAPELPQRDRRPRPILTVILSALIGAGAAIAVMALTDDGPAPIEAN